MTAAKRFTRGHYDFYRGLEVVFLVVDRKVICQVQDERQGPKSKKKSVPKGQRVDTGPNGGMAKTNKGSGAKPKGRCFPCGMTGLLKQNCLDYLSKKRTTSVIESLVSKIRFASSTSES